MPRTRRRHVRRLSRTGAGWTLGEIIMITIAFSAIVAALAIIIYEVEVNLPERQGVVQPDEHGMVERTTAKDRGTSCVPDEARHGELLVRRELYCRFMPAG